MHMREAENLHTSDRHYLVFLALTVLALSLVPILLLGRYDVPASDDYSYGAEAHLAFVNTGSISEAIRAAGRQVEASYTSWQGTWSAIFIMALQPAVFNFKLYGITPMLMLTAILVGFFSSCRALFSDAFGEKRWFSVFVGAMVALIGIQMMPFPAESLYWYNGSVYYTAFQGVALFSFSLIVKLCFQGKKVKVRIVLLMILNVLLGGGNYVTALVCLIVDGAILFFLLLTKNGTWKRIIGPAVALVLSFAASILAPGNAYREYAADLFFNPMNPVEAIVYSFRAGGSFTLRWLHLPVIGWMVLLSAGVISRKEKLNYDFRYPWILTLFSYCLFSAMFCPSYYAMGHSGPMRLWNINWYTWLVLVTLNTYYWAGWIKQQLSFSINFRWMIPAALVIFVLSLPIHLFNGGGYTSTAAIGSLISGEAKAYYETAEKRLEILNNPEIRVAVLPPYPTTPYLLFTDDITEDPDYYSNQDIALFYGKERVVLGKTEP